MITLYLIGFVVMYVMVKLGRNKDNWFDIAMTFCMALTSWLGIAIILVVLFFILLAKLFERMEKKEIKFPHPPKWL